MTREEIPMDDQPYTEADVDLVAQTINDPLKAEARAILDRLADGGRLAREHHRPLLALDESETEALIHGALFWFAGEGAMDGAKYEALQTALAKIFPAEQRTA